MGVPEFYLNVLSNYRLETFEFLLSLHQYVEEKDRGTVPLQSALPTKVQANFSPDVGDIVWYFVNMFRRKDEFMEEVNEMVNVLQREQSTDIPRIRDHVLRMANDYILCRGAHPFSDTSCRLGLNFRDYLLTFVSQQGVTKKLTKLHQDNLKTSISSPAIVKVRKFFDFYAMHLDLKEPKSYMKFFACVCVVLLKVANSEAHDSLFQVLGEVENVICKYTDNFPGYTNLDNAAKYEKLLISGKLPAI